MQIVVALCHFCELNGPSVVFTTQTRPFGTVANVEAELLGQGYEVVDRQCTVQDSQPVAAASHKDGTVDQGTPATSTAGQATTASAAATSKADQDEESKTSQHCRACQSFSHKHHGFVSLDNVTKMHYITSQEPHTAALYGIVRNACLRSLSSEICPGREGAVLFGSDQQGYVFSLTFYLKDSEARGRTRLCSIVICSHDKLLLSSSWRYLVECCGAVVEEMRLKATRVFERDQHDPARSSHHLYMQTGNKALRRPEQVRSIAELCNQPQLYVQLHQSFSWMLSGLFTRIQPIPMRVSKKPSSKPSKKDSFDDDLDEDDCKTATSSLSSATGIQQKMGETGLEVPCFSSLKHMHKLLGAGNFHQLSNHVVRGSQIIVRSDSAITNETTLALLESLLPAGCCVVIANSEQYLDSYRCNLLGMHLESALPQYLSGSEVFVLFDIVSPSKIDDHLKSGIGGQHVVCDVEADPFSGYHFVMFCGGSGHDSPRNSGPLVLQRLTAIVGDPFLDENTTVECLHALKEEWMSKVHVAYRFSRRASADATAGRPRLLQVLQVGPEELPVLQFWMRALDSEQRSVLRQL